MCKLKRAKTSGKSPGGAESRNHGWQSLGPVTGHRHERGARLAECGRRRLRIIPQRVGIMRIRLAPNGVFRRDHSWAVVLSRRTAGRCHFTRESVRQSSPGTPCLTAPAPVWSPSAGTLRSSQWFEQLSRSTSGCVVSG